MRENILGIYVDESGNFSDAGDKARFCVVTLVACRNCAENDAAISEYKSGIFQIGADPDSMVFHAGPLIRQEEQFSAMSRNMRGRIFYQMLSLVRKCDLKFRSFCIDTDFVTSEQQIVKRLGDEVSDFAAVGMRDLTGDERVVLHYDAGQKNVTSILDRFVKDCACPVEVVQGVRQSDCIMLQVADFLCMMKLLELRMSNGIPLNSSEKKFFGSERDIKRNILRKLQHKELK